MNSEKFNIILESRIVKMRAVLAAKASEYATGRDRLHNFKFAADFLRQSPNYACLSFLTKHLISIVDIVMCDVRPSAMVIDEKIGDAINYLVLLEALLLEDRLHEPPLA